MRASGNDAGDCDAHPEFDGRVVLDVSEPVATVTLDRPKARNAMTTDMWKALRDVFRQLHDVKDVRAVILRGASGTFSAGHDIKEMNERSIAEIEAGFAVMEEAIAAVEALPVPTIGVLRGVAAGGGCELLLACDVRVAARTARIGMPVARLGITISSAFAERLVDVIGASRAKDLLFTGRLVRGSEAYRMGLVNHAGPEHQVEERARRIAERIASLSPTSIRHSKQMVDAQSAGQRPAHPPGQTPGVDGESTGSFQRFTGNPVEFREGVNAWIEKREPIF